MTELVVGTKYDQGKLRWDLVPPEFEEVVKVLTFGANKYADRNWEKGINYGRLIAASLRHLYAWVRGERLDPETGLHHLAHMGCDILFLLTYEMRGMSDFNDIPAYDRRNVEATPITSNGRVGTDFPSTTVKTTGWPVARDTRVSYQSQGDDYRQAELPGLDPDYCCEYNGA